MTKYSISFDDLESFVMPQTGKTAYETAVEDAIDKAIHRFLIKQRFDHMMLMVTDEDRNALKSYTNNYTDYLGGAASFEDALIASGLTKDLYDDIQLTTYKEKLLWIWLFELESSKTITAEEVRNRVDEDYRVVEYVFIYTSNENTGETLDEKAQQLAYQKAAEAYNEALAGKDFLEIIDKYNEDKTAASAAKGMAFIRGANERAFEDAAFSLEIGEVSEPAKATYGYFVIHRREVGDYIYEGVRQIQNIMREEKFNQFMTEWRAELSVEIFDDILQKVDINAYF